MQQRVQQRTLRIAGARMNDQARWFIDDEYLVVLINYLQGNRLRVVRNFTHRRRIEFDGLAASHFIALAWRDAVNAHMSGNDPLLHLRTRYRRKHRGKSLVQSVAGELDRHHGATRASHAVRTSRCTEIQLSLRAIRFMLKIIHVMIKVVLLIVVLALTGCASTLDPTKDWTVEQFYDDAKTLLDNERYEDAIQRYEQLQGRFPYGRYTEQAQLDVAYAYHKFAEPALALAACDRFIRQYPTHPNVDYAYYLKGFITFPNKHSFVNWLFRVDDDLHDRDVKGLRESYDAFKELTQRFPQSRYAEDARLRMDYLFQSQARHEVSVARYYLDRGAYVAAVNRTKYALENFPRTPSIEDALGIQAMAYKKMGIAKLLEDTVRILMLNFPQSRYLDEINSLG